MRAQLKSLFSSDVDLESFQPADPEDFVFAMIGPEGEPGAEAFQMYVCTPKALLRRKGEEAVFGRHRVIVFDFNLAVLKDRIERLCSAHQGETWGEIARELASFGQWEFEDHTP